MAPPNNEASQSLIWWGCFVCWLLFGVFGFTTIFPTFLSSVASRHWPSADGVIEWSEVQSSHGRNGTAYGARVAYKYTVNGVPYSANRVGHADYVSSHPNHAQSIVLKYKTGAAVPVYYDPADPSKAVLEVGAKKFTSLSLLACLACVGIGIFGLKRNWKNPAALANLIAAAFSKKT
jgi:hypothetical protein